MAGRIVSQEDISAAETGAGIQEGEKAALAPIEAKKARRKEQYEEDVRSIDARIDSVRDDMKRSALELGRHRSRMLLGGLIFLGTIAAELLLVSTFDDTQGTGGIRLIQVVAVFVAGLIVISRVGKGAPERMPILEKALKRYPGEILRIESEKTSVIQAYERDMRKFSEEMAKASEPFAVKDADIRLELGLDKTYEHKLSDLTRAKSERSTRFENEIRAFNAQSREAANMQKSLSVRMASLKKASWQVALLILAICIICTPIALYNYLPPEESRLSFAILLGLVYGSGIGGIIALIPLTVLYHKGQAIEPSIKLCAAEIARIESTKRTAMRVYNADLDALDKEIAAMREKLSDTID